MTTKYLIAGSGDLEGVSYVSLNDITDVFIPEGSPLLQDGDILVFVSGSPAYWTPATPASTDFVTKTELASDTGNLIINAGYF